MEKSKIKAVVFDLDGVVTDTAEFHYIAWKNLANRIGIDFDRTFNENLKGISRMESLELILEQGDMAERFSPAEKVALATEKNDEYVALINDITPADILPGILDFLQELKDHGIKTAIASASKNAPAIVEKLEIRHFFDYIADVGAIPNPKPAPDIFLVSAAHLGAHPSECVGIEDAAAGVEAIKAAHMMAVGIGEVEQLGGADLILDGTAELSLNEISNAFLEFKNGESA
ncbi:MAG: beta-phosphoglucomutase [Oscillospiraceae bacterium]|nr:beta-phosphoglucomutase [Oscillospiraceae bacterium]